MSDVDEFERDLLAMLSPEAFGNEMKRNHTATLAKAVTGSAKTGFGPNDVRYPAYAESYQKRIAKAGGQKLWLVGLSGPPHMLDLKRFTIEVGRGSAPTAFVWTALTERMGVYASVHNDGLPIGPGGPVKRREFMHFKNTLNEKALALTAEASIDSLAADFAAGRTPR